jgi:hypothetical protein
MEEPRYLSRQAWVSVQKDSLRLGSSGPIAATEERQISWPLLACRPRLSTQAPLN